MSTADWSVWAGSAAGTAHLRNGRDSDDAFATQRRENVLLLAVADGASGARLGAVGARLAVKLAIAEATAMLAVPVTAPGAAGAPERCWPELAMSVAGLLPRRFAEAAGGMLPVLAPGGLKDLATTLSLAILDPPWIALVCYGDCFVVTQSGGDHLDLLYADRSPGHDDGPVFLSDPVAGQRVWHAAACIPDLSGIALSTDGLENVALEFARSNPVRPFTGFFMELFGRARDTARDDTSLARFLASERLSGQTEDDKTLLMAVRSS